MKIQALLMAALAVAAAPLAAQGGGQDGQRGGGRGMMSAELPSPDSLAAQLSLSADQSTKVASLTAAYDQSTAAAQKFVAKMTESGDMSAMRTDPDARKHMTAIREGRGKFDADLKAILNADQVAMYDELYPARRGRGQGRGGRQG